MGTKSETKSQPDAEDYLIGRSPDYRKYYATNVMVEESEDDVRVDLFNEKVETDHGLHFISDASVILTPQAAKILLDSLRSAISEFERKKGPIAVQKKPVHEPPPGKKNRQKRFVP